MNQRFNLQVCSYSSSFCTTNGGPEGWRRSCEVTEWVLVMCLMWIRTTETETANRISRQKQTLAPGFLPVWATRCCGCLKMVREAFPSSAQFLSKSTERHTKRKSFFKVISKYNRLTDWRVSLQLIFFLQTPSSLLKLDHKPCGNVAYYLPIDLPG